MPKIVRFHETGAAEVLELEDLPLTEPGEGEVRLKVEAIGLNRADLLFRQGQYLQKPEPVLSTYSADRIPGKNSRVCVRTVERDWKFSRVWLADRLEA